MCNFTHCHIWKKFWLEKDLKTLRTVTVTILPFHFGEVTFKGNLEIWFLSCDIIEETLWISLEGLVSAFTGHTWIALLTACLLSGIALHVNL